MRSGIEPASGEPGGAREGLLAETAARHGPMVFQVCRRLLGNHPDAEDAAQAVFIVLARKAGALRDRDRLAAWLHGVATQVCRQALRQRARRLRHETEAQMLRQAAEAETQTPQRHPALEDLDRALAALPGLERQAVILRYLEERSQEEAAALCGCPVGTLSARASRGLQGLRERLSGPGAVLGPAVLSELLASEARIPVSEGLLSALAGAAQAGARGGALTVAARATVLAEAALRAMFMLKLKWAAAGVLASLLLAALGGALANLQAGEPGTTRQPGIAGSPGAAASEVRLVPHLGHAGANLRTALSPDGQLLATLEPERGRVCIWEAGKPGTPLWADDVGALDLAFAPSGKSFVVLAAGEIRCHAWPGGDLLKSIPIRMGEKPRPVEELQPLDGTCDIYDDPSGGGSSMGFITPAAGRAFRRSQQAWRRSRNRVAFVLDERHVAVSTDVPDAFVAVWDLEKGVRTAVCGDPEKPLREREWLEYAPALQGRVLALRVRGKEGAPADALRLYSIETGSVLRVLDAKGSAAGAPATAWEGAALYPSPNGDWLVEARVWRSTATAEAHYEKVPLTCELLVWNADSGALAARRYWKADENLLLDQETFFSAPCGAAILPLAKAKAVWIGTQKGCVRWDWERPGEPVKVRDFGRAPSLFRLSPDDSRLGIAEPGAPGPRALELPSGNLTDLSLRGKLALEEAAALALSPDGRLLACGGEAPGIALWDLPNATLAGRAPFGQALPAQEQDAGAYAGVRLQFAPDSTQLILARGLTRNLPNAKWTMPHLRFPEGAPPRVRQRPSTMTGSVVAKTAWQLERWGLSAGTREALFAQAGLESYGRADWGFALNEKFAAVFTGRAIRRFDLAAGRELPALPLGMLVDENLLKTNVTFLTRLMLLPGRGELLADGRNLVFLDLLTGQPAKDCPQYTVDEFLLCEGDRYAAGLDSQGLKFVTQDSARKPLADGPRGFGLEGDALRKRVALIGEGEFLVIETPSWSPAFGSGPEFARQLKLFRLPLAFVGRVAEGPVWLNNCGVRRYEHHDYRLLPGGRGVLFGQPGGVLLADVATGQPVARFHTLAGGGWAVVTPDGLFTGDERAEELFALVRSGLPDPAAGAARTRRNPAEIRRRIAVLLPAAPAAAWAPKLPGGRN